MSLINTMLQDLDKRQAGLPQEAAMTPELRPVHAHAAPRTGMGGWNRKYFIPIAAGIGVLLLATLLYFSPKPAPAPGHTPRPTRLNPVAPPPATAQNAAPGAEETASAPTATTSVEATPQTASQVTAEQDAPAGRTDRLPAPVDQTTAVRSAAATAPLSAAKSPATPAATENLASTSTPPPASAPPPAKKTHKLHNATSATPPSKTASASAPPAQPSVQTLPETASIHVEQSASSQKETNLLAIERAADMQRRGDLSSAQEVLRKILASDQGMVAARLALASVLLQQQHEDEAQNVLREGLAQSPTDARLLLPYVRMLAAQSKWRAADAALAPVHSALARDPEYRALRGTVMQQLGQYAESVDEYRAALQLSPMVGSWWIGLAVSLENTGQALPARQAYLQARNRALSPELAQFVDNKLLRLGSPAE